MFFIDNENIPYNFSGKDGVPGALGLRGPPGMPGV